MSSVVSTQIEQLLLTPYARMLQTELTLSTALHDRDALKIQLTKPQMDLLELHAVWFPEAGNSDKVVVLSADSPELEHLNLNPASHGLLQQVYRLYNIEADNEYRLQLEAIMLLFVKPHPQSRNYCINRTDAIVCFAALVQLIKQCLAKLKQGPNREYRGEMLLTLTQVVVERLLPCAYLVQGSRAIYRLHQSGGTPENFTQNVLGMVNQKRV